ncbi:hypothetical protein THIX_20277 [Thiomonas sp. X19]|nr:hypothetical protein THIX_20277 [Thiomonas sp. X19]
MAIRLVLALTPPMQITRRTQRHWVGVISHRLAPVAVAANSIAVSFAIILKRRKSQVKATFVPKCNEPGRPAHPWPSGCRAWHGLASGTTKGGFLP